MNSDSALRRIFDVFNCSTIHNRTVFEFPCPSFLIGV